MENQNQKKNQAGISKNETNIGMESVEIKYFKKFLIRNIKLLTYIILSGSTLSIFYALIQKNVWQGEFQVVLQEKVSSSRSRLKDFENKASFLSIANINVANQLDTQVEILKSPSVLMSVFDFLKKEKEKKNEVISFRKWLKNLSISLEEGTSVLNIKYKDTDRSIILPVLNKISEKYQKYSGKEYQSELKLGIKYLSNQIDIFKIKSQKSLASAQRFSIENDLPFLEIDTLTSDYDGGADLASESGDNRVDEANSLKLTQMRLKTISGIDNSLEIVAFAKNIPDFANQERILIDSLRKKETDLFKLKEIYNSDSKRVLELLENIKTESQILKRFIIEYLNSQIILINSRKNSLDRPIDIVLEHQSLWQEAGRNNRIYDDLESQFIILKLDEAKEKNPWKLITNPTLLKRKVEPRRSLIVFRWFFSSIAIGLLISYLRERLNDKIYSDFEFENIIPYNLIDILEADSQNEWRESLKLFAKSKLINKKSEKIGIIVLGEDTNLLTKVFYEYIIQEFQDKTFYIINDLNNIKETDTQILLFFTNSITKDQLNQFLRRLKIIETSITGWFLIEKQ